MARKKQPTVKRSAEQADEQRAKGILEAGAEELVAHIKGWAASLPVPTVTAAQPVADAHTAEEWKKLTDEVETLRKALRSETDDLRRANEILTGRLAEVFGIRDLGDKSGAFTTGGVRPGYISPENEAKKQVRLAKALSGLKAYNVTEEGYGPIQDLNGDFEVAQALPATAQSVVERKRIVEDEQERERRSGQFKDIFSQFFAPADGD